MTHCHIDHVGRIPYLLAAGFKGPIYTSPASAKLLPLVIEDALKVGVTRNESMIRTCLKLLKQQIVVVPFNTWLKLTPLINDVSIKFKRAGHILGSAYIEVDIGKTPNKHRVVFSGDLCPLYTIATDSCHLTKLILSLLSQPMVIKTIKVEKSE